MRKERTAAKTKRPNKRAASERADRRNPRPREAAAGFSERTIHSTAQSPPPSGKKAQRKVWRKKQRKG
jgi:hypothetical protein